MMLEITLNCQPDLETLTQLVQVAMQEQNARTECKNRMQEQNARTECKNRMQEQKSLGSLLDEAIAQYLQAN